MCLFRQILHQICGHITITNLHCCGPFPCEPSPKEIGPYDNPSHVVPESPFTTIHIPGSCKRCLRDILEFLGPTLGLEDLAGAFASSVSAVRGLSDPCLLDEVVEMMEAVVNTTTLTIGERRGGDMELLERKVLAKEKEVFLAAAQGPPIQLARLPRRFAGFSE